MSVRLLPGLFVALAACHSLKDGGEGRLVLFQEICPVPGWARPWSSPLSARWSTVPSTATAAYASFQAMTDGSARSMVGVPWRDLVTGEVSSADLSVEMTAVEPIESVIWSFDEAGLDADDVLGWQTTGLRELEEVPADWPACDTAVVTGTVRGVYRHGDESWVYEGVLTNEEGTFVLTFNAGPAHGDVDVRLDLDHAGRLIYVLWTDAAGEAIAVGFFDQEAEATE